MKKPRIPEQHAIFRRVWQYRNSVQYIEREYLELRVRLRDAEAELRSDSENLELMARVDYLKHRLKDFESLYPWVCTGIPSEIPFWVMPAG